MKAGKKKTPKPTKATVTRAIHRHRVRESGVLICGICAEFPLIRPKIFYCYVREIGIAAKYYPRVLSGALAWNRAGCSFRLDIAVAFALKTQEEQGNITKFMGCGYTNQGQLTSGHRILSHSLLEVFQGETQARL